MNGTDLQVVAQRILANNKFGWFTTENGGHPHTRLVQPLEIADGLSITFSTSPHTRKAAELRNLRILRRPRPSPGSGWERTANTFPTA